MVIAWLIINSSFGQGSKECLQNRPPASFLHLQASANHRFAHLWLCFLSVGHSIHKRPRGHCSIPAAFFPLVDLEGRWVSGKMFSIPSEELVPRRRLLEKKQWEFAIFWSLNKLCEGGWVKVTGFCGSGAALDSPSHDHLLSTALGSRLPVFSLSGCHSEKI